MAKKQSEEYHVEIQEKLQETYNEAHNAKLISYANLAILVILLAFVIGVVVKQLGF